MSDAPSTSWANWAWQAYKDGRLVDAPVAKPDRERVAFAMWKAEADRAAPNVGKHRIPLGFAVAAYDERERWLGLADAAIRSMLETGKEVMPDGTSKVWNHDAAPASTDDAGGGATREEIAEALWIANMSGFVPQMRSRFADIESYNRNHWLKLADVSIKTIKGEKK